MSDDKKPKEVIEEVKSSKKESTLYYFYSTGCAFCKRVEPIVDDLNGYHDANILKLDLSDSDNQGLKRELENKYDLRCGTPWLVDSSNGNHICGATTTENVKKWVNGEKIPEPPKPKSPPPSPPKDLDDKKEVDTWKKSFIKWSKENKHLPNIPKPMDMLSRFKQQKEMMKKRENQNPSNMPVNGINQKIIDLEMKLDKLLNHLGVK